jgi:hypothetical protein
MVIAYWIVAGLLALFFLYAGGIKVVQTREQLRPMMAWVDSLPMGLVRTIGVLEVLGAIGLILPPLTGIAPWLALAAAIGLVLVQIGGIILHLSRGEATVIGLNIVLVVAAGATVWLASAWVQAPLSTSGGQFTVAGSTYVAACCDTTVATSTRPLTLSRRLEPVPA